MPFEMAATIAAHRVAPLLLFALLLFFSKTPADTASNGNRFAAYPVTALPPLPHPVALSCRRLAKLPLLFSIQLPATHPFLRYTHTRLHLPIEMTAAVFSR